MTKTQRSEQRRDAGFTLVELLVVITILGMAAALMTARGRPPGAGIRARGTALELAGALRLARSAAIAGNRPVGVRIDVAHRTYQIDNAPPRSVPDGLDVSMTAGSDQVRSPSQAAILFEPDGSSTGGRISLRGQGLNQTILTDWLSGRVTIETNR